MTNILVTDLMKDIRGNTSEKHTGGRPYDKYTGNKTINRYTRYIF